MAVGSSELAAVFARRAAKTNDDAASSSSATKPPLSPPADDNSTSNSFSSNSPPKIIKGGATPLLPDTPMLPKSTTSNQCAAGAQQPSAMAAPAPSSPVATKSRNILSDEEKAKFEARNLEAGIPTPSFLANVRKNLKKPGSEKTLDNTTTAKVEHIDERQNNADDGQSRALPRNNSSIEKTPTRPLDAATRTQHTRSHSFASSMESAPIDEETDHLPQRNHTRSKSDAALHHETLSARRTRMVESRSKESSSLVAAATAKKKTTTKSSASGLLAAVTPGNVRREKLLARVRASKSNKKIEPINKGYAPGTAFDATKLSITSPTKDEFEVLFADELEGENQTAGLTKNESIDSLTHEMANLNHSTSTHGSAATIQTNNVTSTEGLKPRLMSNQSWSVTPSRSKDRHEQRIANASTPKIRGAHPRENFESVQSTAHQQQKQIPPQSLPTIQCSQESDILNILPSPHGQQKQQKQPDTTNLNLTQPYSLKDRTPSQLSQLSAITTPSCFPQDVQVPPQSTNNRGLSHLQQPMLIGVTIQEAASFEGNTYSSNTPSNMPRDSNTFEPTLESENTRLREKLSIMSKRVEEKDAIISQLMKRIADLESTERAIAKGANMAAMTTSSLTPRSNPVTLLSPMSISGSVLWGESSQLSQPNSAFHSFRSNSVDTESSLSVPSSAPLVAGSRTDSAAGASSALSPTAPSSSPLPSTPGNHTTQRVKLRTSSTASTASVTTSASGKSAKMSRSTSSRVGRMAVDSADKPKTRSRSVGGSSRRRRSSKNVAEPEERKFVC